MFADRNGSAQLVFGAVKTNIGHLEAGSGIAGFIKTVLAVKHGHIPTNLNFERLKPHASEGASRFTIAAQGMEWPAVTRPRRAGVSSFGVGGTNAHVVMEQAPDRVAGWAGSGAGGEQRWWCRASRRSGSVDRPVCWPTGWAVRVPGWGWLMWRMRSTITRARHAVFATVCARDRAGAWPGLRAVAAGRPAPGVVGAHAGRCAPGTVFVFSGQGSQWAGMGRRLLAEEPAFAAAVAGLEPDFVAQTGFSLQQTLTRGDEVTGIERVQPVFVGVQLALAALWRSYGVTPDAVIGHSMGEMSAAVVAGGAFYGRRVEGDRHPVAVAVGAVRAGRHGVGGAGRRGHRGAARGLSAAGCGGVSSPRQTVIAGRPSRSTR